MKKSLLAFILTGLTIHSLFSWDGGCGGGYYGGGYNRAPAVVSYQMGRYYGYGGCGAYGGYGGGYWGGSSSFGNQYGQWGNGQGATLMGIAAIIGAAVPILAPPQQQVITRQGY